MAQVQCSKQTIINLVVSIIPHYNHWLDLKLNGFGEGVFAGKGEPISFSWNKSKLKTLSEDELIDMYNKYNWYYDDNYIKHQDDICLIKELIGTNPLPTSLKPECI